MGHGGSRMGHPALDPPPGAGLGTKHAMSGMQSGQDPSIKPSLHFPLRSRLNSTLRSQSPLSKAIAHTFVAIEGGRLRAQVLGRGAHAVRVHQTFPVLCRLPKAVKRLKSCARSKVMLPGGHRVHGFRSVFHHNVHIIKSGYDRGAR